MYGCIWLALVNAYFYLQTATAIVSLTAARKLNLGAGWIWASVIYFFSILVFFVCSFGLHFGFRFLEEDSEEAQPVVKKRVSESSVKKEYVNVIFIGHVDAGKSTIGGQIMYVLSLHIKTWYTSSMSTWKSEIEIS